MLERIGVLMGYLARKTDVFLQEWKKNPDRYPLIIKGARQVGKTETIRRFAKENYKNVIEINFITEPAYKVIIEEGFSADNITKLISRIDPSKHFDAGETLLFFDEIQDFPEIVTALKFFKEDGRYDIICSGSLLGVQYHRIASISVGYKTDYQMYSMDFEEFLWAKGYAEGLDKAKILSVYRSVPAQLAKENKKFQYSKVTKGGRSKDYMGCTIIQRKILHWRRIFLSAVPMNSFL